MSRERNPPNPEYATLAEIETAAKAPERTLRLWVAAFNQQGIDGLIEGYHPGRPKAIAAEQETQFTASSLSQKKRKKHTGGL